jgi:hypothetical protein
MAVNAQSRFVRAAAPVAVSLAQTHGYEFTGVIAFPNSCWFAVFLKQFDD